MSKTNPSVKLNIQQKKKNVFHLISEQFIILEPHLEDTWTFCFCHVDVPLCPYDSSLFLFLCPGHGLCLCLCLCPCLLSDGHCNDKDMKIDLRDKSQKGFRSDKHT